MDYRGLSKYTIKKKYPLLIFEELVDQLNGAKRFLKINLKTGYNRIRIRRATLKK